MPTSRIGSTHPLNAPRPVRPKTNPCPGRWTPQPKTSRRRVVAPSLHADNVVDFEAARLQRQQIVASADTTLPAQEKPAQKKSCPPCHWGLIVLTLFLTLLSIPIIYSASTANALEFQQNADFFFWRQVMWVGFGLAGLWMASRLSESATRRALWVLYFASIVGLIAIEFSPVGVTMGGGQRWLKLGPIPIQVSEFAKIALIGVLADFWSRAAPTAQKSWWPWLGAMLITAPLAGLVFIQPHLSATLLLLMTPFILALYAPVPGRQWLKIVMPLVLLVGLTLGMARSHNIPFLKDYQQDRIASFLPAGKETDARGANYQQLQGLRALRRGGLLGVGPGASLYKQGHLPAPHTDFVLAIIGEEWGLVGMLTLMALYGLLIFFCMQVGVNANSSFEALLCAGVGALMGVQLAFNTGIITGWLPVTGIPLPLLSYGGSGLICTLLGLGLVLAVSRRSGGTLAESSVK